MITKNFNEIKYKVPEGLSLKQIEILEWAVPVYAFVMWPRTKFTFGELADAISNYYDRNTPQTSEAIRSSARRPRRSAIERRNIV